MAATTRGHIERLPSGSYRVHVYGGTDPVTGKPRRIRVTCSSALTGPSQPYAAPERSRFADGTFHGLPVFGVDPVSDYAPLLQKAGFAIDAYEETPGWRERVRFR